MPKFLVEDELSGKKYEFEGDREPTQTEVEDYVLGTITAYKPTKLEEVGRKISPFLEKGKEALKTAWDYWKEPVESPLEWEAAQGYKPSRAEATLKVGASVFMLGSAAYDAARSLINTPHFQYLWSKIAYRPEFKAIPKETLFSAMQKITSGQGQLTPQEDAAWKQAGAKMENLATAFKKGGFESVVPRFGGKPTVLTTFTPAPQERLPAPTSKDLAKYKQWLKSKEPFQPRKAALEVPLHPAPKVSLDYTDVPKSVAKDLPTEVKPPIALPEAKIQILGWNDLSPQEKLQQYNRALKEGVEDSFEGFSKMVASSVEFVRTPKGVITWNEYRKRPKAGPIEAAFNTWLDKRIALRKKWAKHEKIPYDKLDDQSEQLFEEYAVSVGLGQESMPRPQESQLAGVAYEAASKTGLPTLEQYIASPTVHTRGKKAAEILQRAPFPSKSAEEVYEIVLNGKGSKDDYAIKAAQVLTLNADPIDARNDTIEVASVIAQKDFRVITRQELAAKVLKVKEVSDKGEVIPPKVKEPLFKKIGETAEQYGQRASQMNWHRAKEVTYQKGVKRTGKSALGIYFSSDPKVAQSYGEGLLTTKLKVVKPFSYEDADWSEYIKLGELLGDKASAESAATYIGVSRIDLLNKWLDRFGAGGLKDALRKLGYDSIYTMSGESAEGFWGETAPEIAVFDKDQILSIPQIQPSEQGIYNPDQIYNVVYQSPRGVRETAIKGNFLNTMDQQLKSGKNTTDPYGHLVIKLVDVYPIKGDSGRVLLPEWEALEDALTNLTGQAQVGKEKWLHFIKKIAVPEKVDNPLFKPIFNAVQHGVDYRTELTITGLKLLNSKFILALPDTDKAELSGVLKLGNELHKEYTPEELKTTFNFNDNQIRAYTNVRRMYSFAFNEIVRAKKIQAEYEDLTPKFKAEFDKAVESTRQKLIGYVSQERIGSGEKPWAVYKEAEKPEDRFFAVFANKADAEKAAKALGDINYMYLRKNIIQRITNRLSLADLEELIDSADVADTVEVNAIRDEIKKRGALHHEVHRLNIPGYDWNMENIVESAIDYLEGASNRLSRNFGKKLADKIYRVNVDKMSTDMRIFSRDFMDSAYNTGSIGFRNVGKLLYGWNLALNTKWLVLNATQPIARTYPAMARYYKTGEVESKFLKSYDITGRYIRYLTEGYIGKEQSKHGLSSELLYALSKLHNQGVLGDQATRLMLGVRSIQGEQIEKILGAYGRFGELTNRTHAAVSGYYIGTERLGLTGKPLVEFMRHFVYQTQVAYGKHNLPLAITRAGDWASFLKMLYTFHHYTLDNFQYINSTMPWHKGAKAGETIRALGALLALGGIKGLPLIGTGIALYMLWKKLRKEGGSLDYDARKLLTEKSVPKGMQDALLDGLSSTAGISLSASVRPEIPFTGLGGAISPGGVPAGMLEKIYDAGTLLRRGEVARAAEKASPRMLESIQKAMRYHREGVRAIDGELLLGREKLGWWDIALTALGFQLEKISKVYEKEGVKRTFIEARRDISSNYNERLSKSIFKGDKEERKKILGDIREHNKSASRENKVVIDWNAVYNRVREMRGRDVGVPTRLKRTFKQLEEVYK